MASIIKKIVKKHENDRTKLLEILRDVQSEFRLVSEDHITEIADCLEMSRVEVEGPATFYHFYSAEDRGKSTIYLNNSATSEMFGYEEVAKAFEEELGIKMNSTTEDRGVGLYTTSCIGMCDQEPAALINDVVFTNLTPAKAKEIAGALKGKKSPKDLVKNFGDGNNSSKKIKSMVNNNIKLKGPVFFSDYKMGKALEKALSMPSLDVIEEVKKSGLRGRGGAGFPTGMKWGFCRANPSDTRYVFCNVDEGEPGTFKDRVLLTERIHQIFEGMIIAGYAIEAKEGYLYLRAEYLYLKEHLEAALNKFYSKKLLGKKILGSKFNFDLHIKVGAGAYICGEESALIESAEGKRGEPRNRPPFPVQVGYLGKPTVVNNPETYGCVVRVMENGSAWFKTLGTEQSAGVKLLSVSGDCENPGIYEVEWGKTVREVLEMVGAKDVQAVQVGGPSGNLVGPESFDRKICYSDLGTGGAFCVIGKERDILKLVHNYMDFFVEESCGFCVPCRAGNVIMKKTLEKILVGNGTQIDIQNIESWGQMIQTASRCGLGQTSSNPLLTSIKNFREKYDSRVRNDVDFMSQFDLKFAVDESCKTVGRKPQLHDEE